MQKHYTINTVSEVGKYSGTAPSIVPFFVAEIFMQKNSIIQQFYHLMLGGPVIK